MLIFCVLKRSYFIENEESKQWLQNLSCPVETPVSASVNLSDDKVYNLTTDQRLVNLNAEYKKTKFI